jgi:hypothetical protein
MIWYALEPEVAGGLGPGTILDTSVHPPVVSQLNYELEDWLGDDLVESFPCFLATERLRDAIVAEGLTGRAFAPVEVTVTPEFEESQPRRVLPPFVWLQPTGVAFQDDFAWTADWRLLVSARTLHLLQRFELRACEVQPCAS